MFFKFSADEKLDIDYILEKINVSSVYGKSRKVNIKPYFDKDTLESEYDLMDRVIEDLLKHKLTFTKVRNVLKDIKEIRGTIARLEEEIVLSEVEFFELKKFAFGVRLLNNLMLPLKNLPEILAKRLVDVEKILDPKEDKIPTFYIYDDYSIVLKKTREEIDKLNKDIEVEKKILFGELSKKYDLKIRPNGEIRISKSNPRYEDIINDDNFVYLSENYGLVVFIINLNHGYSELMKKLNELKEIEQSEEEKVKIDLSDRLKAHASLFLDNIDRIGHLDFILGKASFAIAYKLTRPEITMGDSFEIEGGINVPVSDRLRKEGLEYTPIDIYLQRGASVITGSNMGGKTVSLKLMGQIAAMAQHGLFVPAKRVKFPLRDYIYISVGDTQDMSLGLSSFAGEMVALSEIINQSDKRGLILVDELSRGTNPQEGYAISRSITDYLNDSNSICVFTSHLDGITSGKIHYQVRGLKDIDFESMIEGQSVIENLHYQMDFTLERVDDKEQVPKEAISIVQMLGLNEKIIVGAKEYLLQNQKGGKKNE
ncbi:MAG: hypothetical protein U9Q80_00155 [Bacillota bacterium]|nr:hypothetical protein [Bacillota bacterium]